MVTKGQLKIDVQKRLGNLDEVQFSAKSLPRKLAGLKSSLIAAASGRPANELKAHGQSAWFTVLNVDGVDVAAVRVDGYPQERVTGIAAGAKSLGVIATGEADEVPDVTWL